MQKDKKRLMLLTVLTITFVAGVALFGFEAFSRGELDTENLFSMAIPLMLAGFMVVFIFRRFKDVKQGMPLEDERSKKVMTQAAAKAFFVSLYWLLVISWLEGFFARKLFGTEQLDAGQTVSVGIVGMAVFIAAFWFYYSRKGRLD